MSSRVRRRPSSLADPVQPLELVAQRGERGGGSTPRQVRAAPAPHDCTSAEVAPDTLDVGELRRRLALGDAELGGERLLQLLALALRREPARHDAGAPARTRDAPRTARRSRGREPLGRVGIARRSMLPDFSGIAARTPAASAGEQPRTVVAHEPLRRAQSLVPEHAREELRTFGGAIAAITSSSFCPVKYVLKNSSRLMPSRRAQQVRHAGERVRDRARRSHPDRAPRSSALVRRDSDDRRARSRAPPSRARSVPRSRERSVSFLPRADSWPYSAHAIASSSVDLPDAVRHR